MYVCVCMYLQMFKQSMNMYNMVCKINNKLAEKAHRFLFVFEMRFLGDDIIFRITLRSFVFKFNYGKLRIYVG